MAELYCIFTRKMRSTVPPYLTVLAKTGTPAEEATGDCPVPSSTSLLICRIQFLQDPIGLRVLVSYWLLPGGCTQLHTTETTANMQFVWSKPVIGRNSVIVRQKSQPSYDSIIRVTSHQLFHIPFIIRKLFKAGGFYEGMDLIRWGSLGIIYHKGSPVILILAILVSVKYYLMVLIFISLEDDEYLLMICRFILWIFCSNILPNF